MSRCYRLSYYLFYQWCVSCITNRISPSCHLVRSSTGSVKVGSYPSGGSWSLYSVLRGYSSSYAVENSDGMSNWNRYRCTASYRYRSSDFCLRLSHYFRLGRARLVTCPQSESHCLGLSFHNRCFRCGRSSSLRRSNGSLSM